MTIYIDSDYKCYVSDDGTRRAYDVPFFDGKCNELIDNKRQTVVKENDTFYYTIIMNNKNKFLLY